MINSVTVVETAASVERKKKYVVITSDDSVDYRVNLDAETIQDLKSFNVENYKPWNEIDKFDTLHQNINRLSGAVLNWMNECLEDDGSLRYRSGNFPNDVDFIKDIFAGVVKRDENVYKFAIDVMLPEEIPRGNIPVSRNSLMIYLKCFSPFWDAKEKGLHKEFESDFAMTRRTRISRADGFNYIERPLVHLANILGLTEIPQVYEWRPV